MKLKIIISQTTEAFKSLSNMQEIYLKMKKYVPKGHRAGRSSNPYNNNLSLAYYYMSV
jgi:hypothetical protein